MWDPVRRELGRLHGDPQAPTTPNVLTDWTRTVSSILTLRRSLGPLPHDDPIALLATATAGANRVHGLTPVTGVSLERVRTALAGVGRACEPLAEESRRQHLPTLTHVAYELAHGAQVATGHGPARTWLLAGETALDAAIHSPLPQRSATGTALAAWQEALAALQPIRDVPIVQRSVALGHQEILRAAHQAVREATDSGWLAPTSSAPLLADITAMARIHQGTLQQTAGRGLGSAPADQAVMLQLGTAVKRFAHSPVAGEPAEVRLEALLRSSLGQVVLVAHHINEPEATRIAARLNRFALEHLANPVLLRPATPAPADSPAPSPSRPSRTVPQQQRPEPTEPRTPITPTIPRGTFLTADQIGVACRTRDQGVAAATANPADPPPILQGTDPATWPKLVEDGHRAVADLVCSVIPMVYAQTRPLWRQQNVEDIRAEMFVTLMDAARVFHPNPALGGPGQWTHYAWRALEHTRWRGVDATGVAKPRNGGPPEPLHLAEFEPVSTTPLPDVSLEQREALEVAQRAFVDLPERLRDPLTRAMRGQTQTAIGEDLGVSTSTARRRLLEARDHITTALDTTREDPALPYEVVTDAVLERSQRAFEATFGEPPPSTPGLSR